jgi:hypothetical protein
MNYLTVDDSMLAHLRGIVEPTEIRDANGIILGRYTPVLTPEEEAAYARAATLFDQEELDRIEKNDHERFSIEQVKEHLRSLELPK